MHFKREVEDDMDEFMQCYEKVYPQLYRTALYYMRNRQEAEDAVQDAVLAAYEKFYQLREKEKFSSWIMQILVNRQEAEDAGVVSQR